MPWSSPRVALCVCPSWICPGGLLKRAANCPSTATSPIRAPCEARAHTQAGAEGAHLLNNALWRGKFERVLEARVPLDPWLGAPGSGSDGNWRSWRQVSRRRFGGSAEPMFFRIRARGAYFGARLWAALAPDFGPGAPPDRPPAEAGPPARPKRYPPPRLPTRRAGRAQRAARCWGGDLRPISPRRAGTWTLAPPRAAPAAGAAGGGEARNAFHRIRRLRSVVIVTVILMVIAVINIVIIVFVITTTLIVVIVCIVSSLGTAHSTDR